MILRLFTENFWWKLISLAVAISFWMTVASEPELETIVSVPVQYENFPKDLEISSDILDAVDVEARGPRGRLLELSGAKTGAVLNFTSVVAPGTRTFTLTKNEIKLPRGLELVRTIPAQLRFTFENKAERNVPVEAQFSGMPPKGMMLFGSEVFPSHLPVEGPASHVFRTTVLRTDPVDLSRFNGDAEQTVAVFVDQPQVRIKGVVPQVRVRVQIRKQ